MCIRVRHIFTVLTPATLVLCMPTSFADTGTLNNASLASASNIDRVIAALQRKIENGSKAFWILPRIVRSSDEDCDRGSVQQRYKILVDQFGKEGLRECTEE